MSAENENIQVVVRCRGRNAKETSIKSAVVVHVKDDEGQDVVLNPSNETGVAAQLTSKTYTFDKVFGPGSDQQAIFNKAAIPLFNDFLKGYNCTMLVYGMTSTGKTYTMSGIDELTDGALNEKAGIIPRVLFKLFEVLNESKENVDNDYVVKCSFVEIYNEELKDLLTDDTNKKLRIFDQKSSSSTTTGTTSPSFGQQTNKSTIVIQNLEEVLIKDAKHGIKTLQKGLKIRQVASTKMNDVSSRSHTIFTLSLYKKIGPSEIFRISKMNLVDLAGSENISRSGAVNMRAKEAGSINQSLLTLGRVINLLVEKNQQHIPYRESKLTRILQDSLGGRTKTCLIATVSPAKINYDETLSTLEYANKAKSIENKPQIGSTLGKEILVKELSTELAKMKADLIATRMRDGIYMNNENHEEFMNDIQEYKTEVSETKRTSELLRKQNDQLKKKATALESQNNEYLTLINTLNATVDSLHNKIDKQKEQEQQFSVSSSKFKMLIKEINNNLSVFKKYEGEAKSEVEKITNVNINNIIEKIEKTISANISPQEVSPIVASIQKDFNQMIVDLQRSTYDACKNVGDTILSKFPHLFDDFENNISQLKAIIKKYEEYVNDEFSKLSKHNNDLKSHLNESLFMNHDAYLTSVIGDVNTKIENDSNDLLNKFVDLIREQNAKQQKTLVDSIRSVNKEVITIEKAQLLPVQNEWEKATRDIINSCDYNTNKLVRDHDTELQKVSKSLKETNKLTSLSKDAINEELQNVNNVTTTFKNNNSIDNNLNLIKRKFSEMQDQNCILIKGLSSNKDDVLEIGDQLKEKIINNDDITGLEIKDVSKVLSELDSSEKEIKKAFLPTGKTPIRQQLKIPKKLDEISAESLNRSPPKFQLIGQRFSEPSNDLRIENKENVLSNKRKITPTGHDLSKRPKLSTGGKIPLRRNNRN
ncbi:Kinesin-like protein [Wickerhamomyces ciferrii]|uniref:Kinesin-like protein n=1 Tax=Wickerhamomyces ciferrii (strain ATCC 14091 / BCRC 22168 / CBS 111 / JCM 3599 / NBRC 0793 / NRRL Y-1031 F-60-10) TaxID=1206466 RepID=K0KHM6_WICCF|nr:Kinesin-like protein [Wickerhamomyces ciferrii]CCH42516.1 Kinesin-like protein [Wickerhamomyces ciferrii]